MNICNLPREILIICADCYRVWQLLRITSAYFYKLLGNYFDQHKIEFTNAEFNIIPYTKFIKCLISLLSHHSLYYRSPSIISSANPSKYYPSPDVLSLYPYTSFLRAILMDNSEYSSVLLHPRTIIIAKIITKSSHVSKLTLNLYSHGEKICTIISENNHHKRGYDIKIGLYYYTIISHYSHDKSLKYIYETLPELFPYIYILKKIKPQDIYTYEF